ncbi:arf-GAP domain and FG repeat-containing protein 1 isoform X2 [Hetaerina americana]|uniref:arf-GAP domain and FG repeat-containing protein 1 isoform X2 n=1 Tax=Hetaerina americana TaxID=62018 RepID=UPI003A7F365D
MASARKKQDEKHLKILRELVSLSGNKQCFDCHQRGPTYVNMTIGSFVCTSCSGMLRGLTPPHRVKSISMASFTPEEIELIKSKGNEYCKHIWLGLYEPSHQQEAKDEQQIKDFMVAKYEKRRYYLEPSQAAVISSKKNGPTSPPPASPVVSKSSPLVHSGVSQPSKPLSRQLRPGVWSIVLGQHPTSSSTDNIHSALNNLDNKSSNAAWLRDFGAKDPFSTSTPSLATTGTSASGASAATPQQPSFANFENNPIFSSQSMPSPAALTSMGNAASSPFQGAALSGASSMGGLSGSAPPSEDRYAALKDLDSLMKGGGGGSVGSLENGGSGGGGSSSQPDWALAPSSHSLWSSPPQPRNTAAGTIYGGGGAFGSPPTSSPLGVGTQQQAALFQGGAALVGAPAMEGGTATSNGMTSGAFPPVAGTAFASATSNPFTGGGALPVDSNSPWVPCTAAAPTTVPAPAVALNPFQVPRTSFDGSVGGQVAWGGLAGSASPAVHANANGQHPVGAAPAGANGTAFQSNQPFYGSPVDSSFLPAYSASKGGWPAMMGNPFLVGSRPQAPTHSSNPFL